MYTWVNDEDVMEQVKDSPLELVNIKQFLGSPGW